MNTFLYGDIYVGASERLLGYFLFLALGWWTILEPAWFGLKQMVGRVDPLAEAMAGVKEGLHGIFSDIRTLSEASKQELIAKVAYSTLEDLFGGRVTEATRDAALLLSRAQGTYRAYQDDWAPHLEALETYQPSRIITVVHGLWTWLQSPEILPVLQAAGRRFGLGKDVAEERRLMIRDLVVKSAPSLAHGFWYGLYATVVFQLLLLEVFYAWGRPRPLVWLACGLVAFNLTKGILLLRDGARLWPVRKEASAIAAAAGIPNLPRFALKLLIGEGNVLCRFDRFGGKSLPFASHGSVAQMNFSWEPIARY